MDWRALFLPNHVDSFSGSVDLNGAIRSIRHNLNSEGL